MSEQKIGTRGNQLRVAQLGNTDGWHIPDSFVRNFPDVANRILAVNPNEGRDKAIWTLTASNFYVASCYEMLRVNCPRFTWNNIVWSSKSFPRRRFILWLVVRGRIKTKDFLLHRGVLVDMMCVLCANDDDTCEHLFFKCDYAKQMWQAVLRNINIIHQPLDWHSEWRWVQRRVRGRSRKAKMIEVAFATTLFYVWGERNARIFRSTHSIVETIHSQIAGFSNLKF